MVVSAALALGELVSSGVAIPRLALEISAAVFLLCGIIEGAVTVAVVSALERVQPGIIREPHPAARRTAGAVAGSRCVVAGAGALAASAWPDGIEKLTGHAGIAAGAASFFAAPIADYKLPFTAGTWPGRVAAALIGVALVYLLCVAVSRAITASKAAAKREGA